MGTRVRELGMPASGRPSGLRRRGAATEDDEHEDVDYEPVDQLDDDDNKYAKFKTSKQRESERKAKVVMYITLVMWIVMIIGMFYKIGEGLYMAWLHKHGVLHTYSQG